MIDIRTIIVSYVTTNLVCASVMALLWLQNRKRFDGIEFWMGNYVAIFMGFVLIALRNIIPDFLSIVAANALIVYGVLLLYMGLERFVGKASSQIYNYIYLAILTLVHAYFTYLHPSLLARNINVSIGIFIFAFQIVWLVFHRLDTPTFSNMRNLGVIAIFLCLISIARIITDLIFDPGNDFLKTSSDSIVILFYQILQIALTLSLFLQVNHRLVVDLERDISGRKQAEEALKESGARYRAVAQSANDAVISSNSKGNIVGWNRGAESIFGYSEAEVTGQPLTILMPSHFHDEHLAGMARVQSGGEKHIIGKTVEVQGLRKDGREFPLEISLAEWQVNDSKFYTAIIRDITERKQAEEALRRTQDQVMEQQRTMATLEERERMARELHDGIGQILGYVNVQAQAAQTLLKKNQPDAAQKNLEGLVQVAQDANVNLRHYILGLRDSVSPQRNFCQALQAYLDSFHQAWNIETVFSPPPDKLPVLPMAVEDQLLHIVQEALINIRKHAEARRVEVLISLQTGEMTLSISDDGCGFDPQLAPNAKGEHFGLSIMRERAEQVGGRMEIRSIVGRGTQVFVYIPIVSESASHENPKDMYSLRILLVDDQPLFLGGMRNLLKARGLTVIGTARDGLEAFEQVKALRPNVVLMDVQMPNCDGIEATRRIKDEFPETKVVLLTVSEDDEHLMDAIKYGASSYLLKNLDANQLFSTLDGLARGEIQIAPEIASRLLKEFNRAGDAVRSATDMDETIPTQLTLRQWEVLRLVARGLTYKEAGRELNVTEPAIKYHMGQILDRLQLKNREQAVAYLRKVQEARKKK